MQRRAVLAGIAASLGGRFALSGSPAMARAGPRVPAGTRLLGKLEARSGGRLGVQVRDSGSGLGFGWRADEAFALCSTFKLSLAALVLREVAAGRLDGAQVLAYSALDVLPASPVTQAHAAQYDLTVLALAQAAQQVSDNLAANLLLARLGGPPALTAFWRALGDTRSALVRTEPALNFTDPRTGEDGTTPGAMAATLAALLSPGGALPESARATLLGWMRATATGANRIRAGVPQGWSAGDKTGTCALPGGPARINDIAVIEPPGRAPLFIAAYYEAPGAVTAQAEAVLAEVGRIACNPKSWRLKRP